MSSRSRTEPIEPPRDTFHVVPTNDLRQHVIDDEGSCWCEPEYDEEENLYVHTSADGREAFEMGTRKWN